MNKRRLLKLADLLEADAKKRDGIKFDLTEWAKTEKGGVNANLYGFTRADKPKVSCETHACAVGLAAVSGAFKRQGLTYRILPTGRLVPVYGRSLEWRAIERFFKIASDDAQLLFCSFSYDEIRGAKAEIGVAKRIRDFVAGRVSP